MEPTLIVVGFALYFFYLSIAARLAARNIPQPQNGNTIFVYCLIAGLLLLFLLYEPGLFASHSARLL